MNLRLLLLPTVALLVWIVDAPKAPAQDSPASKDSVLAIGGSGHFPGQAAKPTSPERVAWQAPHFPIPFEFPLESIATIKFEHGETPPAGDNDLLWEFVGGEILVGQLIALTDSHLTIESPGLGEVKANRGALSATYRTSRAASTAGEGSLELSRWKSPPKSDAWQEVDSGGIVSKTKYARLWRTLEIPQTAKIELELSWRQKAGFSFELTKESQKPAIRNRPAVDLERPSSYRLEVAGDQLVAAREVAASAELAHVQEIALGEGRLHLLLYIDQSRGEMTVCRPSGEAIAKVQTVGELKEHLQLVRFSSGDGDLRIESLRILPWSGIQNDARNSEIATITLAAGSDLAAKITGFDRGKSEWILLVENEERRLSQAQVKEIRFAPTEAAPKSKTILALRNGMVLHGDLSGCGADTVTLKSPLLNRELDVRHAQLLAIYQRTPPVQDHDTKPKPEQRLGRLEAEGLVSKGLLVNHVAQDGASVIGWKPHQALNDAPLIASFSGKIVYQELPPPPALPEQIVQRSPAVRVRSTQNVSAGNSSGAGKSIIHLRTGDMVSGEVLKINDRGVELSSSETKATFIAHDQLRAVELMPRAPSLGISKAKKDRLLMLPRMQRESPPTHLVRSQKGDYLRCRIVSMDKTNLDIEVRLESKRIPRNTIARILWLHPEDAAMSKPDESTTKAPTNEKKELLFQAIPESRKRLTFTPEKIASNLLVGKSNILGECTIDLQSTSVLLIGSAIENSGIPLAFEQWKLRPAPEPLAVSDTPREEGAADGLESVLVGKPAPEIELSLLDGKKFSLAKLKNKVVVLDFWASWCGPCIQAMPQIHQVAGEFKAEGVELVGINLEETPERISATLKRLDLDLLVALDRDGRVAGKYGASSIPQTVIIDAQGNVARVFVGGGARLDDQIRESLQALTGKKPTPTAPAQ